MFPIDDTITVPDGTFTLDCDARLRWAWHNNKFIQLPQHSALSCELSKRFVQKRAKAMLSNAGQRDRKLFVRLLREMEVPFPELCDLGAADEVKDLNLEAYYDWYYSRRISLPVLSHSNHSPFFDQYFSNNDLVPYKNSIACMGNGPFRADDLLEFCSDNDIGTTDEYDADALTLGRNDWSEHDIDCVIDLSHGRVLRVYSQEMFVSVLAGQADPFDRITHGERIRDLYEYRAGHAGLIYVSKQWTNWPHTFSFRTRSISSHHDTSYGAEESPLHALGYRVGHTGESESRRRDVLSHAFMRLLPPVESASYMQQWGEPSSGMRLQRIAEQLARNIERQCVNPTMDLAVDHWERDLRWLRETFYRGTFRFNWPETVIYT